MKALLAYPTFPDSFWGFKFALPFISRKAVSPPLGLLTVAALLPADWELRLVDLNVRPLTDDDYNWADITFVSAMIVQEASARSVASKCREAGIPCIGGGPIFTANPDSFPEFDFLVLDEAERSLPKFISDWQRGSTSNRIYRASERPNLAESPLPRWDLVDVSDYASLNLQYSRGCPFNCEFCDITVLFGRKVRTKEAVQVRNELDTIYESGWRGDIFIVDDNFIGNRSKLKKEILPCIEDWQSARGFPFRFQTEVSINIADDEPLIEAMVNAGFNSVFVGIETPHDASLAECGKSQNRGRDLHQTVRRIQRAGLQVTAGFILGFDNDPPNIFERLVNFIQESGVVSAMVGLLNAPRSSRLYTRLLKEGRLLSNATGSNTDGTINFVPKMHLVTLLKGYRDVVRKLYSPKLYYQRVRTLLLELNVSPTLNSPVSLRDLAAFMKTVFHLGIAGKERKRPETC
jgi:radical SAM superfamily enzyme YgiQ (UPF0313 family)